VATGFAKSKYVADHGFQPFADPPGSGNFSCIAAFSDDSSFNLTQIDIGLEAAYPNDGQLQIILNYDPTGGETIPQDFLAGADFFTSPVNSLNLLKSVQIQIVRTDGGCTSGMEPQPVLRYVTFYGRGINPFI